MRNVTITLVVGLVLLAAIGAWTLTRSPPRLLQVNDPHGTQPLYESTGDLSICQQHETLPAGLTAIRLSMWAFLGWNIHVEAYYGGRVLTEGSRVPDWTSTSVTVPVKPVRRTASGATLCFATGPNSEPELILGEPSPPAQAAALLESGEPVTRARVQAQLPGRFGVEYLTSGEGSWWSRISTVAAHMGLGRSFTGAWIAILVAVLMAAVCVISVRLTARELP